MKGLYVGTPEINRALSFKLAQKRFRDIFKIEFKEDFGEAIELIKKTKFEMVIIDIDNIEQDYEAIKLFKEEAKRQRKNMIFVGISKDKGSSYEALRLGFDYSMLAPLKDQEVTRLVNFFYQIFPPHKIKIVTMPSFAVYVDGELVKFKNGKTKEMLALLVDHEGHPVTNPMIIDRLWPDEYIDKRTLGRCRVMWDNLKKSLEAYDAQHIIGTNGTERFMNRRTFECDLYEMLDGCEKYINTYGEKYLEDYPWAEETKGRLTAYLMRLGKYCPID